MGHLRGFPGVAVILALLIVFGGIPSGAAGKTRIERASDSGTVTLAQMVEEIRGARIVFVGENHGNRDHHRTQLDVIRSLHDAGVPVAVGLEMFRSNSQESLDGWVGDRIRESDFVRIFDDNWSGNYWPAYRDIFEYARVRDIPMIGLNVDRKAVRQASRGGFASVDRRDIPPVESVSCNPDGKYLDVLRQAMGNHAGKEAFVRFCEAQMLWDASMAWHLIDYAERNPGRVVVVMAGAFHSWKHGIPERVRAQSSDSMPFKVILPAGGEDPTSAALTGEEADYLVRYGA
ncbi:MAG TPA: ChaN family lipoprotein [Candidatus Deferrimicrobiaceae bacterium]